MASLESRLFYSFLRLIGKKRFLELQFAVGVFDFYNCKVPPREVYKVCDVRQFRLNNRNVFTLSPRGARSTKHILYLHGGAYVQSFVKRHWNFLAAIVERTNYTITAPDYPLAPASTYRDAFDMVLPICSDIMASSGARNVIIMGDSAGGGFALALSQVLREEGLSQPWKLILLCPWLDISLSNPDIAAIDPLDPFLSVPALRRAGKAYTGNGDARNFLVSPIYGGLKGLAEIVLFIGSRDVLAADARTLKRLAEEEGVQLHFHEYQDMVHMWMFMNFPEARAAQQQILDALR